MYKIIAYISTKLYFVYVQIYWSLLLNSHRLISDTTQPRSTEACYS